MHQHRRHQLRDVRCTSYGVSGDEGFPTEEVKIEYGEVDIRYQPQRDERGGIKLDCADPTFCVPMELP